MVFYRKYRPQTIDDLDSANLRDTLYAVLGKGTPHAFLFTGPKGLGKTSAARIVAKVVNCETINQESRIKNKGKKAKKKAINGQRPMTNVHREPCNVCNQCASITNGTNIDILEIDGASNRGIDEMRDLREKIRLLPVAASKKVYIIDEVHMLTAEAFNALLKTLEEPPPHALFILCTTEPQKVPETIMSRCFHVAFRLATEEELMRSFERIAHGEGLTIDKQTLSLTASLADGSFRDGAKILEEIASLAKDKKITKELVEERYHIVSTKSSIAAIVEAFVKKDAKIGLLEIGNMIKQGVDMKYFLEQLLSHFHDLMLAKIGVSHSTEEIVLDIKDIKEIVALLTRAHSEMRYAVLSQLPLELAILEWSSIGFAKHGLSTQDKEHKQEDLQTQDILGKLIDSVKVYNHSIAGVLRGCSIHNFDEKNLVIETAYKFHKEKLEEKKTIALIEKIIKELTGKTVAVSVLLKGK